MVDGLKIKGDLEVKGLCEDCIYGKHTSRPYSGKRETESKPKECMYIDLWGPASTKSLGGAVYMMLLADGCTARLTGYFLTCKDAVTTLTAFTNYHAESERQTGYKLQNVCMDAGREWMNE